MRVEQLFGLLKSRWGFLNREMQADVDTHVKIKTCIAIIHNFSKYHGFLNIDSWRFESLDNKDDESRWQRQLDELYMNVNNELRSFTNQIGPIYNRSDADIRVRVQARRIQEINSLNIQ